MSAERQKTLEECAAELAEYTDRFLSKLPRAEQERRIRAFKRVVNAAVLRQKLRAQPKRRRRDV